MQRLVLIALCALATYAAAQTNGYTSTGSYSSDAKLRFETYLKFVARASCGCDSAKNPEGDFDGCASGSGSAPGGGSGSPSSGSGGAGMTASPVASGMTSTLPPIPPVCIPFISGGSGVPSSSGFGSGSGAGSGFGSGLPTDIPPMCIPYISGGGSSGAPVATTPSDEDSIDLTTAASDVVPTTTAVAGGSSGSSSGSGDECETSGDYAAHHGGWYEGDLCLILRILLEWCSELTIEESTKFEAQIRIWQKTIIEVDCTDEERFERLSLAISIFFEENVTIKAALQWKFIDFEGESWGFLGFIKFTALDSITVSSTHTITIEEVLEVSGGTCPLIDACNEWAGNDAGKKAAAASFNAQVLVIVKSSASFEVKCAQLRAVFASFSTSYSQYASEFFSVTIKGSVQIGSFQQFCEREWHAQNFDKAIGGDFKTCPILIALEAIESNTSYSISYRSQTKQYRLALELLVNSTTSIETRTTNFSAISYQYNLLNNWNASIFFNIQITGYGTFADYIDACNSWQNGQISLTTGAPSTTTVASEETTTIAAADTTTASAPATTTEAATCANVFKCNTFDSFYTNSTILIHAIEKSQATWSNSTIKQFAGYLKNIYNKSKTGGEQTTLLKSIQQVILNCAGSTTVLYKQLQATVIEEWGNKLVSDFCAC